MARFTARRGRRREVGEWAALLAERALVGSRAVGRFADPRRQFNSLHERDLATNPAGGFEVFNRIKICSTPFISQLWSVSCSICHIPNFYLNLSPILTILIFHQNYHNVRGQR